MLPRVVLILLEHRPELQADGLREAVINIVERALVDMTLPLPALAVAVERDIVAELHPRHIHAQQLFPDRVALRRGHIRLFVDDMLEVVDHRAVRDEGQRARQMTVEEFAGIAAEEALGPRPGEELHGHGVHLARLEARPDVGIRDAVAVEPRGEGMAGLVRHDLDVMLRAVEVGEDKRHMVVAQRRAVAARALAGGRKDVQQLVIQHEVEELAGLRRQGFVEPLALRENFIRRAARLRVAAAEHEGVVGEVHGIGLAEAGGLLFINRGCHRHDIFDDGRAELLHVFLRIAVAAHAVIAQLRIAAVAQLAAHRIAQMHELVIDLVQLRLVRLVPAAFRLPRGKSARVVRAVFERGQLRDGVGAALKFDLRAGDELVIGQHERVFLLQLLDDRRGEGLAGHFGVDEHEVAVLRGEVLAERAFEHCALPCILIGLQLRQRGIPELLFRIIELIAGVDRVADAGERGQRLQVDHQLLLGEERLVRGGIVRRILQLLRHGAKLRLQFFQIRPGIRHFRKFHGSLPSYL